MVWSSARIAGDTAAAPVKQRTGITFANRRISLPDVRSAKGVPRRNWRKGKGNGENDWSGRPGSNRRPSAPKADTLPLRYAPKRRNYPTLPGRFRLRRGGV